MPKRKNFLPTILRLELNDRPNIGALDLRHKKGAKVVAACLGKGQITTIDKIAAGIVSTRSAVVAWLVQDALRRHDYFKHELGKEMTWTLSGRRGWTTEPCCGFLRAKFFVDHIDKHWKETLAYAGHNRAAAMRAAFSIQHERGGRAHVYTREGKLLMKVGR